MWRNLKLKYFKNIPDDDRLDGVFEKKNNSNK
jgi:hypothetical protein